MVGGGQGFYYGSQAEVYESRHISLGHWCDATYFLVNYERLCTRRVEPGIVVDRVDTSEKKY